MSRPIAATVTTGISGLRPRPGVITPIPSTPSAMNRYRYRVCDPIAFAVERTDTPSANANNAWAYTTFRCGADDDEPTPHAPRPTSP